MHEGSEQTKIVSVICIDCKETMTVLALASAKIIEGRCPGCTKAFNKKQEEYNKSIGYTPGEGGTLVYHEPIPDLQMNALSCNAVFGLEWVLQREVSDRVIRLLKDGLTFCNNIVETEQSKSIKGAIEKILEAYQPLVDEEAKAYFRGEKAKAMLVEQLPKYSEQEIRTIQHFFNKQGRPYLQRASAKIRRRHGGCF